MAKHTHFIVVEYNDYLGPKICIDYPKYLTIPRVGETVGMNFKDNYWCGIVSGVRHNITGNIAETRIIVKI